MYPAKMRQNERTRGRVLGAEWNGRYTTMYRPSNPSWDGVISSLILPREKGALPTPLRPSPFSQQTHRPPPVIAVVNPRAGRSEYNFLYCVNVRTYVWIRKMFILRNAGVFRSLRPPNPFEAKWQPFRRSESSGVSGCNAFQLGKFFIDSSERKLWRNPCKCARKIATASKFRPGSWFVMQEICGQSDEPMGESSRSGVNPTECVSGNRECVSR